MIGKGRGVEANKAGRTGVEDMTGVIFHFSPWRTWLRRATVVLYGSHRGTNGEHEELLFKF